MQAEQTKIETLDPKPDIANKGNHWPLFLALLTVVGLALRFWKIGAGLPSAYFGDEGHYIYFAMNMPGSHFNPHFYPALFFYLCFFMEASYILGAHAAGKLASFSQAWTVFLNDPSIFYILGRSISAVLGALTIPLTYVVGEKMFAKQTGFIGALFITVCFMHVQYSQIAYLDVTLTFFMLLSFFFSLRALEEGRLRDFALAGLMGGLAVSTKYNGLPVLMWAPLACIFLSQKNKENLFSGQQIQRLFFFTGFFMLGFTLGTPFWIIDLFTFAKKVASCWSYYKTGGKGQLGSDGQWNWFYYLGVVFPGALGWPLTVLAIFGMLFLIIKFEAKNLFFAAFPVLYVLVSGSSSIRAARYMIPLLPFFCIAASFLIFSISRVFQKKGMNGTLFLWLAAILFVLPSGIKLYQYFSLKNTPDTRQLAYQWIVENVQPGQRVIESSYGISFFPANKPFTVTDLDPTIFDTRLANASSLKSLDEYRKEGYQYLILDEWHMEIVMQESPKHLKYQKNLDLYQKFLSELESVSLLAEFSPYQKNDAGFDIENVQFAARNLSNLKSLGPKIYIYKLK